MLVRPAWATGSGATPAVLVDHRGESAHSMIAAISAAIGRYPYVN